MCFGIDGMAIKIVVCLHKTIFTNSAHKQQVPVNHPLLVLSIVFLFFKWFFFWVRFFSTFINDTTWSKRKQVLPVREHFSPPLLCLLGWPSISWGIVCRCAWREASPSALGEHVVWECLRWHSFKLSPTQHAGVCLFFRWQCSTLLSARGHSQVEVTPAIMLVLTNKRDSS